MRINWNDVKKQKLITRLSEMGFSFEEVQQLRRIERTLNHWAAQECGDGNDHCSWAIERDETTGKPFRVVYPHTGKSYRTAIADRERGALNRLEKLMATHPGFLAYHQCDPRGCALYIVPQAELRPGDKLDSVYTRGVAVCL